MTNFKTKHPLTQTTHRKLAKLIAFLLLGVFTLVFSCGGDDTPTDDESTSTAEKTPTSAFAEFNPDAVTVSFDGDEITIESNGLPNHTSPYWAETEPLHIEPIVAPHLTPGGIGARSFTLTVPAAPELAATSSATGLGPIGISVTGVPI